MLKELLKLAAAGLGAAAVQIVNLLMSGTPLSVGMVKDILIGTVLVRIAMWVVAKFGPQPAPA